MYQFKDKKGNIVQLNNYMLAKTLGMFEYQNLPKTIPYRELEKLLQMNGKAFITEVNGELYALRGSLGGEVDAYNNPTQIVIANVGLKYNATLDVEKDGVLMRNDDMNMGLLPLFEKYHFMLVENDINMIIHGYNTRSQKLISASDDKTKESAEAYLKKVIDGDVGVIGENAIFEGVKVQGAGQSQAVSINNMIEFSQYLKATLYNEVGLSANFNMKRERLISAEIDQSEDSLFPFVYSMMKNRLKAIDLINEKYGTDIKIDFGSVWHFKNKELVDDEVDPNKLPNEAVTETAPETDLETKTESETAPETDPETKPESETETETESETDPETETKPESETDNKEVN